MVPFPLLHPVPPRSTSLHPVPPRSTSLHPAPPHSTSLHLTPPGFACADREAKFGGLLAAAQLDLDKLKTLSWAGIPTQYRAEAWQLMLAYLPLNRDRRASTLKRKRKEYHDFCTKYFDIPDCERMPEEQKVLHQILVDIPRTKPDIPLFFNPTIQRCLERVLYIWAIRHPASSYVQGIDDLLTAFFVVFMQRYVENPYNCDVEALEAEVLGEVEADCFWCLTKMLDGIQDHYTWGQPGTVRRGGARGENCW